MSVLWGGLTGRNNAPSGSGRCEDGQVELFREKI
jgi:hypothetical protein